MDATLTRPDLLERLAAERATLRPSEARVAEVVLAGPEAVPRMNLAMLARRAGVSEPTVLRFCRSLGLDGYAHFKIELARTLARGGEPYLHREIGFGDSLDTIHDKVFQSSISGLAIVQQSLDREALATAVQRLAGAGRIDCMAVGLSNVVAQDAQQKLIRLGAPCIAMLDAHQQTLCAATLRPGDVALTFSYNGRIKDTLRCVRVAREAGAFTIAVTRSGTPLAEASDLLLNVDPPEDTFVYSPMTTRLAHLAVVDVLATGVAMRRGPQISEELERIKETVSDQWLADDEQQRAPEGERRGSGFKANKGGR